MAAKPRSDVIDPHRVGIYHCYHRLVQQWFLFGLNLFTGRDYSHRKIWVRDRLRQLAGCMAVEVLDYGILDNHLHLVLRNRPDVVASWSDEEVLRRWWRVCPDRRNPDGSVPEPKPCELQNLRSKYTIEEYRTRLSSISWFMQRLCQPIAVRANKEAGTDGHFFAGRFKCDPLESEADVLNCSLYVDLNWIRAGMAKTPEDSEFTSAYDRIQARWQQVQCELDRSQENGFEPPADDWLAPIFLDERAEAYVSPQPRTSDEGDAADCDSADKENDAEVRESAGCNPIGSARLTNKGFLPITLKQYLTLLDTVGRIIREGKRGSIPDHLPPILQRLGLDPQAWLDSFLRRFDGQPPPRPSPAATATV